MSRDPEGQGEETQKRQPPKPRPVIVRIFRAFKRYENRRRRRRNSQHQVNERMMARWTRHVGLFTGALAVVGIMTAVIFWRQLNVMQEQLAEMRSARESNDKSTADRLRIMSGQLDWPWIRLSKVVPLGLSVWEAGVIINLDLHAKNIGHSPAETVYATGRAFSDMSLTEITSAARAICDEDPSKHLEFDQSMIFPDEDRHIQSSPFIIGTQEIKNRWMERIIEQYTGEARSQQLAQPIRTDFTVIGCIIYSYRGRGASGQTAFALDVHRSCEIDLGRYPMCTFDVSHLAEYPAADLVITESFTGLFTR